MKGAKTAVWLHLRLSCAPREVVDDQLGVGGAGGKGHESKNKELSGGFGVLFFLGGELRSNYSAFMCFHIWQAIHFQGLLRRQLAVKASTVHQAGVTILT